MILFPICPHGPRTFLDYRPHCNLEKLNAQIRNTEFDSGQLELAGVMTCGFGNRWGDGIFTVIRDLDRDGRLVRVRLDVGDEIRQSMMRRVRLLSCGAIVTHKVLDREPIGFAERLQPGRPNDSGWALTSGTETQEYMDDPRNMAIIWLGAIVDGEPELKKIIDAPVGSVFRRTKNGFEPDE